MAGSHSSPWRKYQRANNRSTHDSSHSSSHIKDAPNGTLGTHSAAVDARPESRNDSSRTTSPHKDGRDALLTKREDARSEARGLSAKESNFSANSAQRHADRVRPPGLFDQLSQAPQPMSNGVHQSATGAWCDAEVKSSSPTSLFCPFDDAHSAAGTSAGVARNGGSNENVTAGSDNASKLRGAQTATTRSPHNDTRSKSSSAAVEAMTDAAVSAAPSASSPSSNATRSTPVNGLRARRFPSPQSFVVPHGVATQSPLVRISPVYLACMDFNSVHNSSSNNNNANGQRSSTTHNRRHSSSSSRLQNVVEEQTVGAVAASSANSHTRRSSRARQEENSNSNNDKDGTVRVHGDSSQPALMLRSSAAPPRSPALSNQSTPVIISPIARSGASNHGIIASAAAAAGINANGMSSYYYTNHSNSNSFGVNLRTPLTAVPNSCYVVPSASGLGSAYVGSTPMLGSNVHNVHPSTNSGSSSLYNMFHTHTAESAQNSYSPTTMMAATSTGVPGGGMLHDNESRTVTVIYPRHIHERDAESFLHEDNPLSLLDEEQKEAIGEGAAGEAGSNSFGANLDLAEVQVQGYYDQHAGLLIPSDLPRSTTLYVLTASDGRDLLFKLVQYNLQLLICFLRSSTLFSREVLTFTYPLTERFYRNYNTIRHGRSLFKMGRGILNFFTLETVCARLWRRYGQRRVLPHAQPVVRPAMRGLLLLMRTGYALGLPLQTQIRKLTARITAYDCYHEDHHPHRYRHHQLAPHDVCRHNPCYHGVGEGVDELYIDDKQSDGKDDKTKRGESAAWNHSDALSTFARVGKEMDGAERVAGGPTAGAHTRHSHIGTKDDVDHAYCSHSHLRGHPPHRHDDHSTSKARNGANMDDDVLISDDTYVHISHVEYEPAPAAGESAQRASLHPARNGHMNGCRPAWVDVEQHAHPSSQLWAGAMASAEATATHAAPPNVRTTPTARSTRSSPTKQPGRADADARDRVNENRLNTNSSDNNNNDKSDGERNQAASSLEPLLFTPPLLHTASSSPYTAESLAHSFHDGPPELAHTLPTGVTFAMDFEHTASRPRRSNGPSANARTVPDLLNKDALAGHRTGDDDDDDDAKDESSDSTVVTRERHKRFDGAAIEEKDRVQQQQHNTLLKPLRDAALISTSADTTAPTVKAAAVTGSNAERATAAAAGTTSFTGDQPHSTFSTVSSLSSAHEEHSLRGSEVVGGDVASKPGNGKSVSSANGAATSPTKAATTPPLRNDRDSTQTQSGAHNVHANINHANLFANATAMNRTHRYNRQQKQQEESSMSTASDGASYDGSDVSARSVTAGSSCVSALELVGSEQAAGGRRVWQRSNALIPASAVDCVRLRHGPLHFHTPLMLCLAVRSLAAGCRRVMRDTARVSAEQFIRFNAYERNRTRVTRTMNVLWVVIASMDLMLNTVRLLQPGWLRYAGAREDCRYRCGCGEDEAGGPHERIYHRGTYLSRHKTNLAFPALNLDYGAPVASTVAYFEAADPARMMPVCTRCGYVYRMQVLHPEVNGDVEDGSGDAESVAESEDESEVNGNNNASRADNSNSDRKCKQGIGVGDGKEKDLCGRGSNGTKKYAERDGKPLSTAAAGSKKLIVSHGDTSDGLTSVSHRFGSVGDAWRYVKSVLMSTHAVTELHPAGYEKEQQRQRQHNKELTGHAREGSLGGDRVSIMLIPWMIRRLLNCIWLLRVHANFRATVLLQVRYMAEWYLAYRYCFGKYETFRADAPLHRILDPYCAVAGVITAAVGFARVIESAPK